MQIRNQKRDQTGPNFSPHSFTSKCPNPRSMNSDMHNNNKNALQTSPVTSQLCDGEETFIEMKHNKKNKPQKNTILKRLTGNAYRSSTLIDPLSVTGVFLSVAPEIRIYISKSTVMMMRAKKTYSPARCRWKCMVLIVNNFPILYAKPTTARKQKPLEQGERARC